MAVKTFKVGSVNKKKNVSEQDKEKGNTTTVMLGSKSSNPKYATTVQLIVRDGSGKVVADVDTAKGDVYLRVLDPRTRDGITEEQAAKIPDFILKELVVTVAD